MDPPFTKYSEISTTTKYNDSIEIFRLNGTGYFKKRRAGLIDMTINKGNSGGPIIKLEKNPNKAF